MWHTHVAMSITEANKTDSPALGGLENDLNPGFRKSVGLLRDIGRVRESHTSTINRSIDLPVR